MAQYVELRNCAGRLHFKVWSHLPDSNRRPADYKSAALPTELKWHYGQRESVCSVIEFDAAVSRAS